MGGYLSRKLVCTSEPVEEITSVNIPVSVEEITSVNIPVSVEEITSVNIPVSVEEITSVNIPLSLTTLVEQLCKNPTQHDYLVALLLVLLIESGFCIMYDLDTEDQCFVLQKPCRNKCSLKIMQTKAVDDSSKIDDSSNYQIIKFIHMPKNWKSITGGYKIYIALSKFKDIPLKLVAVPMNDEGFFNISTWVGEESICNMDICTANYVCPCPHQLCKCSENLKIISYMLKDDLVTPTKAYILASLGLPSPSLQGLPIELQRKVIGMVDATDVISLAQCSRRFLQVCSEERVWNNMEKRYIFSKTFSKTNQVLCVQFRNWFYMKSLSTTGVTESDFFKWFTLPRNFNVYPYGTEFRHHPGPSNVRYAMSLETTPCSYCGNSSSTYKSLSGRSCIRPRERLCMGCHHTPWE